jgi:phage terminase small subunit
MDRMDELNSFARKHGLTLRQAQFVLKYDGNGTRTARLAGYQGTDKTLAVTAHRLLSNEKVIRALDRLTDREMAQDSQGKLLTRNDLMQIWSELATDKTATWKDRLKAMDSLAKSQGIFIDRSQIISNVRVDFAYTI